MKCIILAGGFATRLWPLTENKAKPLLHLKDKPLISHIVDQIPEDVEIIVSTNAVFEPDFKAWAKEYPDRKLSIFVEDSEDDEGKKGALGATALAIEKMGVNDDLMLIAGDNYFGFNMADFISAFKGNPMLAAYDIKDKSLARRFGVVVKREGKVAEFQEKPEDPKSTLVSTGCYCFPQKNLADIARYAKESHDDLGGVFEYLLSQGEPIDVFTFEESAPDSGQAWYDIGSFDAYIEANKALIGHQVIEMEGVELNGENELAGSVYLGSGVMIKNSVIENSIILEGSVLKNCVIRNSVVDENCHLKNIDLERKMVRRGSNIEK